MPPACVSMAMRYGHKGFLEQIGVLQQKTGLKISTCYCLNREEKPEYQRNISLPA